MSKTILVTGAIGNQGGALINALLAEADQTPVTILALTRSPASAAAKALAAKSSEIKLVTGDLDDPEAIFSSAASTPIWGVFSVQLGIAPGMTVEREEMQGRGLINAAIAHGVQHFVYASAGREGPTNVPQFQSKQRIEQHLFEKAVGGSMTWTVLRPVVFFENMKPDIVGRAFAGCLKYYIPPTRSVAFIATADIGWFAAQAFLHPESHRNVAITLAGDSLTFDQFSRIFKVKTGKNLPLPWGGWLVPCLLLTALRDLGTMFKFFADVGFDVDIEALKKVHPRLMSFGDWLEGSAFMV